MFLDVNQQHISSLQVKLKKETLDIKKCRESGVKTITISKHIPLIHNNTTIKTKNTDKNVDDNITNNSIDEQNVISNDDKIKQIKISKKVIKKLDVIERLNLARKEAILERKIDQLKIEADNEAKIQVILKAQQILENLPTIKKSHSSSTISQSPNSKLSSSLPLFKNDQQISKQDQSFISDTLDGKYLVSF